MNIEHRMTTGLRAGLGATFGIGRMGQPRPRPTGSGTGWPCGCQLPLAVAAFGPSAAQSQRFSSLIHSHAIPITERALFERVAKLIGYAKPIVVSFEGAER